MPAFNATLGNSAATSYIDVAQADDYYLGTLLESNWAALSNTEKESSLLAATRALETLTYAGTRCTPSTDDATLEQALQWPRSGATCKGITATCAALPNPIVEATASLALNIFTSPPTPGAPSTGTTGAIKSQKLGDLSQDFYDVKEGSSTKVDASAPLLLQQYPYLVDLLSCWSDTATGAGRVILRVRS